MHYALCRMLCRLHRPGRIHPLREARCISIDVSHPRIICIRISLRSPCITHAHKIQTLTTHAQTHTACMVHIVSFNKCFSQSQKDDLHHRNLSAAQHRAPGWRVNLFLQNQNISDNHSRGFGRICFFSHFIFH